MTDDPIDNHQALAAVALTRIYARVSSEDDGLTEQRIEEALALIGSDADLTDVLAGYVLITRALARWVAGLVNECTGTQEMGALEILDVVTETLIEGDARR